MTFTGVRVRSPACNRLTRHHVGSVETFTSKIALTIDTTTGPTSDTI